MSNFDQRLQAGWRVWSEDDPSDCDTPTRSDPRWLRELDQIAGTGPKKTRSVPIKLLTRLLLSAHRCNSAWLDDFADDVVVIDADLHEVLLAFEKFQQESTGQDGPNLTPRVAA
ncbi:hypothetical protein Mal15_38770 [Stieleria maiorica]|uniref:Uncharacterized protein n=2 Tax=Stieleria maiorica TaxID=2795974 RepID=A0A5B9MIM2_9BACT|nr:hypothetical protein Mal15_38770 [Stieleria maiorica]